MALNQVIHGDCLAVMPTLEANSFDAVVTDPPYHLTAGKKGGTGMASLNPNSPAGRSRIGTGFMGKAWDGGDTAFRQETWAEVLRVLKPGAFMVCFASTRGYHRMVCAIEDAGFIIHPMLGWITGQGFAKASRFDQPELDGWRYGLQALKPALEPICMAQKPMERGLTGSQNWAKYRVGGLNIHACRVPLGVGESQMDRVDELSQDTRYNLDGSTDFAAKPGRRIGAPGWGGPMKRLSAAPGQEGTLVPRTPPADGGRWPANVLHDGSNEVIAAFPDAPGQLHSVGPEHGEKLSKGIYGDLGPHVLHEPRGDSGSAARFFYTAKADAGDRAGSKHPTVKPTELMRYLVRLVTPPGDTVLDPFCGTGSTLVAAHQLQCNAIGIEQDATYVSDARRKIVLDAGLFAEPAA